MYRCCNCKTFFEDGDFRASRLEDSTLPSTKIIVCPACGSDELDKAGQCIVCGEPIENPAKRFCGKCENEIKNNFIDGVNELAKKSIADRNELLDEVLDLLCE